MRQSDLELYRWKFHNDIYIKTKRVQKAKSLLPLFSYWKQHAAFVSVLPRQSGKSNMLVEVTCHLSSKKESYVIYVPDESIKNAMMYNFGIHNRNIKVANNDVSVIKSLTGIVFSNMHLLVDEFDYIERKTLDHLLNKDWRSVTMVSTLR